jgi:hypothetical protein
MPIPEKIHVVDIDHWLFYDRRVGKQVKFSWLPRRCYLSGKLLFLKKSVVITGMMVGPGDIDFHTFWCDEREFFLDEFKGKK